ncbi:trehalose synthase [Nannochloropsis gaditana]|uniref:Trehalose synthase n=1 Tax=Nannochloropsis gaditana TaxID=72520 RepID=W7T640_9STRA|nr:trehalose synthase [Nannochloropsis gaditana]
MAIPGLSLPWNVTPLYLRLIKLSYFRIHHIVYISLFCLVEIKVATGTMAPPSRYFPPTASTSTSTSGQSRFSTFEPQDLCRPQGSLHDGLPRSTRRQVQAPDRIPQPIYLGIEVEVLESQEVVRYGLCAHDGSYTLDYYEETIDVSHCNTTPEKVEFFEAHILQKLKEYQSSMNVKAHLIGLGLRVCNTMCFLKRGCATMCVDYGRERVFSVYGSDVPSLSSRVWQELDAIPFVMRTRGQTLDERASTAVRQAVVALSPQYPGNIPRVVVGYRNEVEVDCNMDIHLYDLEHYRQFCSEGTWHAVLAMADELRRRQIKVSYFNSTPQGGGVALMRHALFRLSHYLRVNTHWFVATPSPDVFNITKRKFHNVLQGVAPPNVFLEEEEKKKWLEWTQMNVERHWDDPDGPLMTSDVIVIDDPQVCGLIPWIRRLNPEAKIVYRSHIEVRADLIRDNPQGPQAQTWDFLWSAIKQADLFVSHPVKNFVPDDVPLENVVMMPAATDPLDGLNKPLDDFNVTYYQQVFNRICYDQGSRRVDWDRPYITQVARFDPSKGIPDVLLAYHRLYCKFLDAGEKNRVEPRRSHGQGTKKAEPANVGDGGQQETEEARGEAESTEEDTGWSALHRQLRMEETTLPQLIICGHGSVDDPDGTWVFEEAHTMLNKEDFRDLWPHVTIVRIPPCDQILNVVLRGAVCALQLSHREGFEVKVTEAMAKGVPVVAYKAGGIPFQIRDKENGYLAPVGDTETVAEHVYSLCTDAELREKLSRKAREEIGEDFFTVHNWANWAYIWLKINNKPRAPPTLEEVLEVKKQTEKGEKDQQVKRDVEEGEGGMEGNGGRSDEEETLAALGEVCLNVDGSRSPCAPPLHRRRKAAHDVLGGGRWVKDLWQAEYVKGETEEGVPRYKELHARHVEAHEARTWDRNTTLRQEQFTPPPFLIDQRRGNIEGGDDRLPRIVYTPGPNSKLWVRDAGDLEEA